MKKKMVTVLLVLVVAASSILGGCGEPQETGGRAEGTEQTKESGETKESQESRDTESDAGDAASGILGLFEEDEPERLVRPEDIKLVPIYEYEYDESGNQTKRINYSDDESESGRIS